MNYKEIFEQKEKFGLFHNQSANYYIFRENQDKGEFVDHNENVVAQLYEAKRENSYFIIAGMFMGDLILRSIPYQRTFRIKYSKSVKPHAFHTQKIINQNVSE